MADWRAGQGTWIGPRSPYAQMRVGGGATDDEDLLVSETMTQAGPSADLEARAAQTGFGALTNAPWTDPYFGAVRPEESEQLQSDWMRKVLGESGEQANALAAEYGLPAQGSGQAAALATLARSQAMIPFARMNYENLARGRQAQSQFAGNTAMQQAMARYQALTRGGTTTRRTRPLTGGVMSTPTRGRDLSPYAGLMPPSKSSQPLTGYTPGGSETVDLGPAIPSSGASPWGELSERPDWQAYRRSEWEGY